MKVALSADDKSPIIDDISHFLISGGHEVIWLDNKGQAFDWPDAAHAVSQHVLSKQCDYGVVLCWTGTGVSIAANKIKGIRAALCNDAETAKGAKLWNNANVLCLSIRTLSPQLAKEILTAWLETEYSPTDEEERCINKL